MRTKLHLHKFKYALFFAFLIFGMVEMFAQVRVPFTERTEGTMSLRGNMTFVSNNILNRNDWSGSPNDPYNHPSAGNNGRQRNYIDIDGDPSTFSSSSADLQLSSCASVVYAGLYWAGNYERSSTNKSFTDIRFRVPGGAYVDLVADNNADPAGEEDAIIFDDYNFKDDPYVCYKNVTNLVQPLADPNGTYVVANVRATEGTSVGGAGGWTMVVIYEDPTLPGRYFTVFDGYSAIVDRNPPMPPVDFNVSGFTTIPNGQVRAVLGTAVLEGDRDLEDDSFQFRAASNAGFTVLGTNPTNNEPNPRDNFFDSNITIDNVDVLNRNPASTNTLGYDSDIFELNNPDNSVIGNNETGGTFRMVTDGDSYGAFLTVFAVDILEPHLFMEKTVERAGVDIENGDVSLGESLEYVITFKNIGNDDAINFSIRDVLPANVNYLDIDMSNAHPDMNATYIGGTNEEILFEMAPGSALPKLPVTDDINSAIEYTIRIGVQVASDCYEFRDACSNVIQNQAFASYEGDESGIIISDDPSVVNIDPTCLSGTPSPANIIANIDTCNDPYDVTLCGEFVDIEAGSGYAAYELFDSNGISIAGPQASPIFRVTQPGLYTINKELAAPCPGNTVVNFTDSFNVQLSGTTNTNPVIPYADDVVFCNDLARDFPKISLCGANDVVSIQTGIVDADSIEWEILDETSCANNKQDDCPTVFSGIDPGTGTACGWSVEGTGPNFDVEDPGQYRITLRYQNGCFTRFYFDVFENPLDPQFTTTPIICDPESGSITITNVPEGYEYALDDDSDTAFGPSNEFTNVTGGSHIVYIRQDLDPEPPAGTFQCVFEVPVTVPVRTVEFSVSPHHISCAGETGGLAVQMTNAQPDYTFIVFDDTGEEVDSYFSNTNNARTFANLNAGTYTVRGYTNLNTGVDPVEYDCFFEIERTINPATPFSISAEVTENITCNAGEIRINVTGGAPDVENFAIYSINGTVQDPLDYQFDDNTFSFSPGKEGTYRFIAIDGNGCRAISSAVTIDLITPPTFDPDPEDVSCSGVTDGEINFINVVNPDGATLTYHITGPVNDSNNTGNFTGLPAGAYTIHIEYVDGISEPCPTPTQPATINVPDPLNAGITVTQPTCTTLGTIEFSNPSGGSENYQYNYGTGWFPDGGTTGGYTFTDVPNGDNYQLRIRDADNRDCVRILDTRSLTVPDSPVMDIIPEPTITCNSGTNTPGTGTITVSSTGGTGPFTYQITSPSPQAPIGAGNEFDNLTPGVTYTVRVTDNNGCFDVETVEIPEITPITLTAPDDDNICFGETGSLTFTVGGIDLSTRTYSYTVNGTEAPGGPFSSPTISLSDLPAGDYEIRVTDNTSGDATGCSTTAAASINIPDDPITFSGFSAVQPNCSNGGVGSATITASGGWTGFDYQLVIIPGNTPVAGYDFATNGPNNTFTNLPANISGEQYQIQVRDVNECPGPTREFTLTDAVAPTVTLAATGCYDPSDPNSITLTATPTPAVGNYNFSTTINGVVESNNDGDFSNLNIPPGTYIVRITDLDTGCFRDSNAVTINPELALSVPNVTISACATTAQIVSSGSGGTGTGTYVYAIVDAGAPAPADGDYLAANSDSTQPIPVGVGDSFRVYVRDNNGGTPYCETSRTVTVTRNPAMNIAPIGPIALACNGDTNAQINASSSVTDGRAPFQYVLSGGTLGATTVTNTTGLFDTSLNLGAGSYTLTVRDNTGNAAGNTNFCEESITIEITEPAALGASSSASPYTCDDEAVITVSGISGGSATPSYQVRVVGETEWIDINGANSHVFTQTFTDGTYTVEVRDFVSPTCVYPINPNLVINPLPAAPTLAEDTTYNCDGTGNIEVTPFDTAYQYQLENGSGAVIAGYAYTDQTALADPNIFTDVPVGNYIIRVDYGAGTPGCTITIPVSVSAGNVFAANYIRHTNITCNGLTDGSITFSVTNFGSGGYIYSLDPTFTTSTASSNPEVTISTLGAGNPVTIYIRDVRNTGPACDKTVTQEITEPDPILITADVTDPATCNNFNLATIEVLTSSGGSLSYEYQLIDLGTGLPFGSYGFGSNGSNDTFASIPEGNYRVEVRDALYNTCLGNTVDVDVVAPDPVVFTATPTDCYDASSNNGEIEVLVATPPPGNPGPYQFSINVLGDPQGPPENSNGATPLEHTFSNLSPNTYEVTVRDSYGCDTTLPITVSDELEASVALNDDLVCFTDARMTVSASGASGNYTYEVATSADGITFGAYTPTTLNASNEFFTNTANFYRFRITDTDISVTPNVICRTETNIVQVTDRPQPVITTVNPTNVNCFGESTGALEVIIDTSIGIPPYTIAVYEDDGTGNPVLPLTDLGTTGLPADDYVVIVTDSKSCPSDPYEVEIIENPIITPNTSSTDVSCTGDSTTPGTTTLGEIEIDATGGFGPYTYTTVKDDHSFTDTYNTSGNPNLHTLSDLAPGDYTITVTDVLGCSEEITETIAAPPGLLLTTSATPACEAGTGTMIVEAQADNGVLTTGNFYFSFYPPAAPYSTGPVPPNWHQADIITGETFPTAFEFTGLNPGVTYTFIVHDALSGCEYMQEATVPVNSQSTLVADLDPAVSVTCTGAEDGTITFEVDGTTLGAGATSVNYEVYSALTNAPLTSPITGSTAPDMEVIVGGLAPGEYYILFEEADGANVDCVRPSPNFTIDQAPVALTINTPVATNDDDCSVPHTGTITTSAQNGEGPYDFQLQLETDLEPDAASWGTTGIQNSSTGVFNNVANGEYTVYVKDANDCIVDADITVGLDPSPEISVVVDDYCADEGTFEVDVTLDTAGMPPYTLSVNGQPAQPVTFPYTIENLSSGLLQTVEVFDLNGCGEEVEFNLYEPIQFTPTLDQILDCETPSPADNAVIRINNTPSAGITYEYSIDGPGASDQVRIPVPSNNFTWNLADQAGNYDITVFAVFAEGECSDTKRVPVPVLTPPVLNLVDSGNESCNPSSTGTPPDPSLTDDGFITVRVDDNGFGPFTFEITGGTLVGAGPTLPSDGYTATFSGLDGSGGITYTIQATSTRNNCVTNTIVRQITEPDPITFTLTPTQFTCTSNNLGNAQLAVTDELGGSGPPYRYEFIRDPSGTRTQVQNGTDPNYTTTDIAGGTYEVNVYDSNRCVGTLTRTIAPVFEIADPEAVLATPIDCTPGSTESVNVTLNTVNNPENIPLDLNYIVTEIDGTPVPASSVLGSSNNPQLISGLDIGSYVITVTNNLTGCFVTTTHEVLDPNTFTIDVDVTQNVICVGASDGAIDIELVNDPAPATPYAGGISWQIFDTNGTLGTTLADIADDTPVVGASGSSLTNADSYTGLPAGDYNIVVTQDNDPACSNIESFSIIEPAVSLTANVDVSPITCTDDGIITIIDQAGGWPGYTYYINLFSAGTPVPIDFTAVQISRNIPIADAGIRYQAWIMDSEGCPVLIDDNIVLNAPSNIDATVTPTYNCTTGTDGQIEVTGTVGGVDATPNVYTYQLYRNGSPYEGPVTQTTPGPTDALFTDLGPGSYQVRIADQYGCFEFLPTAGPIEFYELMNAQPEVTSDLTCNPGSDGEITITITGGSGNFSFAGFDPSSAALPAPTVDATGRIAVFAGLDDTTSDYTFTITDLDTGSSCTTTAAISLTPPQNPAVLAPTVTDVTCATGVQDGTVQINLDPGTSVIDPNIPYTYTLTLGPVGFTLPPPNYTGYFDELAVGDYEYTVISNIGCPAPPPLEFTIEAPAPLTLSLDAPVTDFMCTSDNTPGIITITANAGGGSDPGNYLYSIDRDGNSSPFGTNNVFQISDSGDNQRVTITVRDANSSATCTISRFVDLTTIPEITDVTFVEGTPLHCDTDPAINPATVVVTVVGGSGNFTVTNLVTGEDQTIITGPPYEAIFEIPAPNNYNFQVVDNGTECTFLSDPYEVPEFDIISATAVETVPVACMDGTEGTIEVTITDYTGTYNYEVLDANGNSLTPQITGTAVGATNPLSITGLSAGSYIVAIDALDSPYCDTETNVVTVRGPGAALTVQLNISNDLTCNGDDGVLTAIARGGWPGAYEYSLLIGGVPHGTYGAFSPQNRFTDLTAGDYEVIVRDVEGCEVTDDETLTQPAMIVATAVQVDDIECEGEATASIEVTSVSGGRGTGFYQYILNNVTAATSSAPQPESETLFTGLSAGTYSVTVIDGWNCDFTTPEIEILSPTELTATLMETDPLTCETDAELQLTGFGGTGPYTFSQSETGPFVPGTLNGGNTIAYAVDAGIYRFYVRDANGCIAISNEVNIEALDPLQIQLDLTGAIINCTGQATATISADAIGGLGEYFYSLYLNTDMTTPIRAMQTSGVFEELPANVTGENYVVRVNSGDCEEDMDVPFISEPPLFEIVDFDSTNVSCTGEGDGAIFILAEGGTGVIKYAISPRLDQFDETNTFMNLTPGLYTVIAQDENGCFRTMEFTIEEPVPVTITEGLLDQEYCTGDLNGAIEVLIEGGTAPYTAAITYPGDPNPLVYEPVTDTGDPTTPMPHTFSGLAGGITYTILVNDVNDCNNNIDITLDPSFDLTADVTVAYGCTDNFSTNTVTVNVLDPTAAAEDLVYTLNGNSQLENVFTNVPPGDHLIEILAQNGCVNNDPDQLAFTILDIEDLGIDIFESNLNEFTYNGTGGVPPYEYYVDGEYQGTDNVYRINHTATYTVRVVDSNGCEFTDTIFIEFYDIEVPPVFTPDNDGINDEWEIINDEGFPNMVTKVYDRYGRWLATLRPGQNWNGMYDGKPLPSGDYWYVIKINGENDPREFMGHFTLYR